MTGHDSLEVYGKVELSTISMLTNLLTPLIDRPDLLSIHVIRGEAATTFFVWVAEPDWHRVCADRSRVIKSLRVIVRAVGVKQSFKFNLEIQKHPNTFSGST